jgi:hypothetical protein
MVPVGWLEPQILRVVWPGTISDQQLASALERHNELLVQRGPAPYGALHETPAFPRYEATQRKLLARWMDEHRRGLHGSCRGIALETSSSVSRGVLTAVLWLMTVEPHYEIRVFGSVDDGASWLRGKLATAEQQLAR